MRDSIFLDIDFLYAVWPNVLGLLYKNIITLVVCVLAIVMGEMFTIIEEMLSVIEGVIYFAGITSLFAVIAFVLRFINRPNPFRLSITSISSFEQITTNDDIHHVQNKQNAKVLLPGVIIFIGLLLFLYSYSFNGNIQKAFLDAVVITLPFHLGFIAFDVTIIILETFLLLSRYIVQGR